MKLTPLDIRHKDFKRGMRGYADVEVDEFLDEVADEYERLFKENIDLHERVESLEEKVAGYKRIEETLQKTLVYAQASAEELKQNAKKEAQLVLQDAELKARQMVNEAYSERQAIEQTMAKLRSAEEDFRFKFRQLLDGLPAAAAGDAGGRRSPPPAPDFSRHAEAIKEAIAREAAPARPATAEPRVEEPEPAAEPDAAPRAGRGARGQTRAAGRDGRRARPEPVRSARQPGLSRRSRRRAAWRRAGGRARRAASEAAAGAGATPRCTGRPPPAGDAAADGRGETRRRRERIIFGESDDLLADVDTGVNENEFKW